MERNRHSWGSFRWASTSSGTGSTPLRLSFLSFMASFTALSISRVESVIVSDCTRATLLKGISRVSLLIWEIKKPHCRKHCELNDPINARCRTVIVSSDKGHREGRVSYLDSDFRDKGVVHCVAVRG